VHQQAQEITYMQAKTGLIAGIACVGLGSGLMFFLDPGRGKQRRLAVRDRAKSTSRQIGRMARSVDRTATDFKKSLFSWKRKALQLVA
jgi:hypothetical protein